MQPVISAQQMREIDRLTSEQHGVSSLALMQSAARACFLEIKNLYSGKLSGKKVRILCGPGNNGGDGAALAELLFRADAHTDVLLFGLVENARGDARINFEKVRALAHEQTATGKLRFAEIHSDEWKTFAESNGEQDVIIDALFGTGLSRPLDGVFAEVVSDVSAVKSSRDDRGLTRPLILSIDIPSGLDADSFAGIGPAIHADYTVTFTAPKQANVLPPVCYVNGKLTIAPIGSPPSLIEQMPTSLFVTEEADARQWLITTRYTSESFKNTHGHVLVIGGSRGYTGAAVLCGNAAMRSGAGLTTVATPASSQATVAAMVMPEIMTTALAETDRGVVSDTAVDYVSRLTSKATVVAIGPGLTAEDERTRTFVRFVVSTRTTPIVVDADALNCLSPWPEELQGTPEAPMILTPHPGEMLRLMGTNNKSQLDDRVTAARDFAMRNKLILVLKGSRSLIAGPDGRVFINPTGNPGVGKAGAGDTLTGLIAGFLAQEFANSDRSPDALRATVAALYVGGLAADLASRSIGMRTMVASDVRGHISAAIVALDPLGERASLK